MQIFLSWGLPPLALTVYITCGYFIGRQAYCNRMRRGEWDEDDCRLFGFLTLAFWPVMLPGIFIKFMFTRYLGSWYDYYDNTPKKVRDFINEPSRRR